MGNAKSNCRCVALSLFALPPFALALSASSLFALSVLALSLLALALFALSLCRFDHKGAGQRILLQDFFGLLCW